MRRFRCRCRTPVLSAAPAAAAAAAFATTLKTIKTHLTLLGDEGKALARDFIVRLIKSGAKASISGDLWSDNGMGLFGIYAHGITETWVMEKALIGLVACDDKVPPPPPTHSPTPASLHSICTMAANDRHVCCHSATRPRTSRLGQLKRLRQLASLTRSWCLVTALRAQHVLCGV